MNTSVCNPVDNKASRAGSSAGTSGGSSGSFAGRVASVCFCAALCFALTQPAAADATGRASEEEFARALQRETQGEFSRLLDARDAALSIERFDQLMAAYAAVADELYADYSKGSMVFSSWWTERLAELGLASLASGDRVDFFREQLRSQDFDRVVHGYYVLSLNRPLLEELGLVSAVREQMLARAKADPRHRYWISLWLAESRLLDDPMHTRTQQVSGLTELDRLEPVSLYVGRNAKELAARIHRILDLPSDLVNDRRVTHFQISRARDAAEDRIRRHWLQLDGSAAGYGLIQDELEEFRTGTLRLQRFQQILDKDLLYLFEEFGLPADPLGWLAQLEAIYRAEGKLRFGLRVGIENLTRVYKARMSEEVGGRPTAAQAPPLSLEDIIARGPDAAEAFVVQALNGNASQAEIEFLLGRDAVPALIESFPPRDPAALRAAVMSGYSAVGHPAPLRANYLTALSALRKLEPETGEPTPFPAREATALAALFAQAESVGGFEKAFRSLYHSAAGGSFEHAARPPEQVVDALVDAALRVIQQHDAARREAASELDVAQREMAAAGGEAGDAQRAVMASNQKISLANAELVAAEERLQSAVGARNRAVEEINDAVSAAELAYETLRKARNNRQPREELIRLEQIEAAALAQVQTLESEFDATIDRAGRAAIAASGEAQAAERRAIAARSTGQSIRRKGAAAARRENRAYDAAARAQARESSNSHTIQSLLNQTALCLELMGVPAPAVSAGPSPGNSFASRPPSSLLAALVGVAARAYAGEDVADQLAGLSRHRKSEHAATRRLVRLVIERQAESDGVFK